MTDEATTNGEATPEPLITPRQKRTRWIQVRASMEERARYFAHAAHLGLELSEFARFAMNEQIKRDTDA